MSTTHQPAATIVNRAALSLYRRLRELERRRGYWPGADLPELLTEWLAGYGIDADNAAPAYVPSPAPCPDGRHRPDDLPGDDHCKNCRQRIVWRGPGAYDWDLAISPPPASAGPWCNHDDPATHEQTCTVCECGAINLDGDWVGGPEHGGCARSTGQVYLVQRDNLDGLYLFANEEDRDAYAALFPGCHTGTGYVINRHQAAIRIAEVCPGCKELREDCECPQPGDRVRMHDEDDGPTGIVAIPTDAEQAEEHTAGACSCHGRTTRGGRPPPN